MTHAGSDYLGGEEVTIFEYSPTFGANVVARHNLLDSRLKCAQDSGITVNLKLVITTKLVHATYSTSTLAQVITKSPSDLRSVEVCRNLSAWTVNLLFADGFRVCFNCTRPHLVALDIWTKICSALMISYGNIGKINEAIRLMHQIQITSLRVPGDYYQLNHQDINYYINLGFSYPANRPPFINYEILKSCVDQWCAKNLIEASTTVCENSIEPESYSSSSHSKARQDQVIRTPVYLPQIANTHKVYVSKWLVMHNQLVSTNQPIVEVECLPDLNIVQICSSSDGQISILKGKGNVLCAGDKIATVTSEVMCENNISSISTALAVSDIDSKIIDHCAYSDSTVQAVKKGAVSASSGYIPTFKPSLANTPEGFASNGNSLDDLKYALSNPGICFQSFFNDTNILSADGINDDAIGLPCFDEGIYCALVKEMHKYSMAEIADKKEELAKDKAGLGAMVGGLLGVFTMNPFAPFLGHSYGKSMADRGKRVEEFLPDPNLLFYEDPNSFLSWSRGQVGVVKLRRLMFVRCQSPAGNVYFRLLPAIVTADSVFPIQLFKLSDSSYFYRPFSAGIERNQPHYDPIKIQKRYYHLRSEGQWSRTDLSLSVFGQDIETGQVECVYKFTSGSFEYFYVDFKIQPGSLF